MRIVNANAVHTALEFTSTELLFLSHIATMAHGSMYDGNGEEKTDHLTQGDSMAVITSAYANLFLLLAYVNEEKNSGAKFATWQYDALKGTGEQMGYVASDMQNAAAVQFPAEHERSEAEKAEIEKPLPRTQPRPTDQQNGQLDES